MDLVLAELARQHRIDLARDAAASRGRSVRIRRVVNRVRPRGAGARHAEAVTR